MRNFHEELFFQRVLSLWHVLYRINSDMKKVCTKMSEQSYIHNDIFVIFLWTWKDWQCVSSKILGRGWTHQLPQASPERNLDICGPFFDVWFTKDETWKISKTSPWKVTLLQLRGSTKSDFAFVRPQLTQLTSQMQKSGQNWTFYGVFWRSKFLK